MMFAPHAVAETGTLAKILKDDHARVVWDSGVSPPAAGNLGVVVERNRLLALFRVLNSEKRVSTVQILDDLLPSLLSKKQRVELLDVDPSPTPPGQASLLVWSDRLGGSFQVDGEPKGPVPARVFLEPGSHEILLNLPEGGRAGAKVEAHPDEDDVLCLHGRSWPSPSGDGFSVFVPLATRHRRRADKPPPLRWLEDRQGQRVYVCSDPIKAPSVRKKVIPKYPESARRIRREGKVLIEGLLGTDGRVLLVDVVASPAPSLSQAAIEATLQWNYSPATLDGKPVAVFYYITVDFYLVM